MNEQHERKIGLVQRIVKASAVWNSETSKQETANRKLVQNIELPEKL